MRDPLLAFPRHNADAENGQRSHVTEETLLWVSSAGAQQGPMGVRVRLLAGSVGTRRTDGSLREHVVDSLMSVETAGMLALGLWSAARAGGFMSDDAVVEGELVDEEDFDELELRRRDVDG